MEVLVDSKGRITLPKKLRLALEIEPGDKLRITIHGERATIEKAGDPLSQLREILRRIREPHPPRQPQAAWQRCWDTAVRRRTM